MTTDRIVALDGRDALAFVILRPGETPDAGAVIEAAANGVSKEYAAHALRHVADQWAPPSTVLEEIAAERVRQDNKWGEQRTTPDGTGPRMPVAGRLCYESEAAEDARLSCQRAARDGDVTWRHILREEVYEAFAEADPAKLREELIQVSAVAVAWIQAIDRRTIV